MLPKTPAALHYQQMEMPWKRIRRAAAFATACVVGARLVIPGVQSEWLAKGFWQTAQNKLAILFDAMTGGALHRGSVLALSLTPYLSARFYMWLAKKVAPRVAALEETAEGRQQLKRWTRGLSLVISLVQSYGYATFIQTVPNAVSSPGPQFVLQTMAFLTISSATLTWLSERVFSADAEEETSVVRGDETTGDHGPATDEALAPAREQLALGEGLPVSVPFTGAVQAAVQGVRGVEK